jgi:hypothetical protein
VPGEVSTHVGAFDLVLFAALVGDDDDDLDDLTSEQIEAARRANLEGGGHRRNDCLSNLSPVREATSEGFRALKIR